MTYIGRAGAPIATVVLLAGSARALVRAAGGTVEAAREGRATFDELVALTATAGAALVLGYVALVLACTAVAALPGGLGRIAGAAAARATPAALRGVARFAVGVGLATGSVAAGLPAHAGPAGVLTTVVTAEAEPVPGSPSPGPAAARDQQVPADVSALPAIGRPGGSTGWTPASPPPVVRPEAAPPAVAPSEAAPSAPGLLAAAPRDTAPLVDEVVVRRGDTLWEVAARALGPDATVSEIVAEWPRWYAANRDVVGDDPDLILPGTVLRAPGHA